MAVKVLPGQEAKESKKASKKDAEDKLNIREYIKALGAKAGEAFVVKKAKLTQSGWLLVETTDWVGFIHGKAEVATNLMENIAPKLHNQQGNALMAVINPKNKYAFVLGTEDKLKLWYYFDSETQTLEAFEEQQSDFLLPTGILKLEDFLGT